MKTGDPYQSVNVPLNAMRALAAVGVLAGHLRALFFVDYQGAMGDPVAIGFYAATGVGHSAVVVFFVLSGYWVGGKLIGSVRAGEFTWFRYATARLVRLWVVLVPALALTAAADYLGTRLRPKASVYNATPAEYHGVATPDLHSHQGLGVALGNGAFLQDLRVPTFGSNAALWSLAYEFWFYAMFPLVLLALARHTSYSTLR